MEDLTGGGIIKAVARPRVETIYDDLGRVWKERVINPKLNASGVVDETDVRETTHAYDAFGNLIQTTFADATTISATYDDYGRKTSETNQLGLTRDFEYDAEGRLAAVELPAVADPLNGGVSTRPRYEYGYDAQGNQTLIRDPLGRETRFTFDAQGRQLTRTLPLGFGPDGVRGTADDGNLPEGSFAERSEYDDRGRQTLHVSFEGVVAQSVYDTNTGRLSQRRFFASEAAYNGGAGTPSETWNYTHDAFGRVVEIERSGSVGSRTETTAHDAEGRVTRTSSPEGTVNHQYDARGRLVRTFTGTESNPIDDVHYAHDDLDRLESVTVVARGGVALATPETTAYGYDPLGNLVWRRDPNGVLVVHDYDAMNRLTAVTHYQPGARLDLLWLAPRLARYDYDLRDDGARQKATETIRIDGVARISETTWTYDDLGRLIDEVIDHYVNDLDQTERFAHDLAGNRLSRILDRGSDGAATPDEVTTYVYDANDRLKTEAWDATGDGVAEQTTTYGHDHTQQTLKEVRAAGVVQSKTTFDYDLQGRMAVVTATTYSGGAASHVERTSYAYDADGVRVGVLREVDADADDVYETATRTEYLNDPDNPTGYSQVLKETTSVGGQIQKTIVYAIGHDVVSQTTTEYTGGVPGASSTLVLGKDGHGSTRFLTTPAGTIATVAGARQVFDYTAHGELLNMTAAQAATSLLYSGEMVDAKIGMQYLRARWYDPSTGRFNRLDPFFGNLNDPQSLHKYLYVHGDPVNRIDPIGLFTLANVQVSSALTVGFKTGFIGGAVLGSIYGGVKTRSLTGALAYGTVTGLIGSGLGAVHAVMIAELGAMYALSSGVSLAEGQFLVAFVLGIVDHVASGVAFGLAYRSGDKVDIVFSGVGLGGSFLIPLVPVVGRPFLSGGKNIAVRGVGGSSNNEIDAARLATIVEYKNAQGLLNPRNRQSPQQWADSNIYDKTSNRIRAILTATESFPARNFSGVLLEPKQLKNIFNYHFEIEDNTPQIRAAVEAALKRLRTDFPDYKFSARFGALPEHQAP